jgi:hypothetical protein
MYLLSFRFKLLLIFFPLSLLFQHVVGIRASVTLTASPNETTTGATISFAWNGANGRPVTLDLKVPSNDGSGYVRIINIFSMPSTPLPLASTDAHNRGSQPQHHNV